VRQLTGKGMYEKVIKSRMHPSMQRLGRECLLFEKKLEKKFSSGEGHLGIACFVDYGLIKTQCSALYMKIYGMSKFDH
jgi:hypothetical protein